MTKIEMIQVGKYYKLRNGKKAYIKERRADEFDKKYPLNGHYEEFIFTRVLRSIVHIPVYWDEAGYSTEHKFDIIGEWQESVITPDGTPPNL